MRVDIFGLQTMLKAVVAECTIAFIVPIPRVFNMLQYVHLTRTLEDYFFMFSIACQQPAVIFTGIACRQRAISDLLASKRNPNPTLP